MTESKGAIRLMCVNSKSSASIRWVGKRESQRTVDFGWLNWQPRYSLSTVDSCKTFCFPPCGKPHMRDQDRASDESRGHASGRRVWDARVPKKRKAAESVRLSRFLLARDLSGYCRFRLGRDIGRRRKFLLVVFK